MICDNPPSTFERRLRGARQSQSIAIVLHGDLGTQRLIDHGFNGRRSVSVLKYDVEQHCTSIRTGGDESLSAQDGVLTRGRAVMLLVRRVGVEKLGTVFQAGLSPNWSVFGVPEDRAIDDTIDGASAPSVLESPLSWDTGDTLPKLVIAMPGVVSFSVMTAAGFFHMLS